MNYSKNASTIAFLTILILFTACGEKSGQEQAQNVSSAPAQSINQVEVKKESGPASVFAFISGNEISKKSFEQGAQLAVSSNASKTFDLKFVDASQGSQASLNSLLEKNKAPAVLYWSVDDISSVATSLSGLETVGIVTAEVNKTVAKLGANVYGFGYSNELTFKQLAKFAGNTLKSYRFAVITANEPYFDRQSKVFIEESKSLGNTIVFEEKVASDNSDFSSLITRAKNETCDTIIALLPGTSLVNFIKAAKASQFKGKLIVGDTLYASYISTLGQDAEGIYMTQAWSEDTNLQSQYVSTFGSTPDGFTLGYAALGYDLVKCLQGINAPLDAYSIKHSLLSTVCEGITGKTQFTGERMAQRRKVILSVRNGQVVKAE